MQLIHQRHRTALWRAGIYVSCDIHVFKWRIDIGFDLPKLDTVL